MAWTVWEALLVFTGQKPRYCTVVSGMYSMTILGVGDRIDGVRGRAPGEAGEVQVDAELTKNKRPTSALDLRPAPPRLNRSRSESHEPKQRLF
jgi:hypothetical protein